MKSHCDPVRDVLTGWVDQSPLSVIEHVAGCDDCRAWLVEIEEVTCRLQTLPEPEMRESIRVPEPAGPSVLGSWSWRILRAAMIVFVISSLVLMGFHWGDSLHSPQMAHIPAVHTQSPDAPR